MTHISLHSWGIIAVLLVLVVVAAELARRLTRPHPGCRAAGTVQMHPAARPPDSTDQIPAIRVQRGGYTPGSNAATAVWQPRGMPMPIEAVNWRLAELRAAAPHLFAPDWAARTEAGLLAHFDCLRAEVDGHARRVLEAA